MMRVGRRLVIGPRADLCKLSNDSMALPASVADESFDGGLAQDEVFVRADFHTEVCCSQDVN